VKEAMQYPSVFEFQDPREFLKACFEVRKVDSPWFSLRVFAAKIGIHASQLHRLMAKDSQMNQGHIEKIASYFELDEKSMSYLEAVLGLAKAKTDAESETYLERINALKEVDARKLDTAQFDLFEPWYKPVVLSLLDFIDISNQYEQIASAVCPPITKKQATQAIEELTQMGLIAKDSAGFWKRKHTHMTTGKNYRASKVLDFQKVMMQIGLEALERHPSHKRDVTSLTLNMKQESLDDLREIARHFRKSVQKRVQEDLVTDSVYQINLQMFPVGEIKS
jgi:uncharacterized protein (TIGR02147 family)